MVSTCFDLCAETALPLHAAPQGSCSPEKELQRAVSLSITDAEVLKLDRSASAALRLLPLHQALARAHELVFFGALRVSRRAEISALCSKPSEAISGFP